MRISDPKLIERVLTGLHESWVQRQDPGTLGVAVSFCRSITPPEFQGVWLPDWLASAIIENIGQPEKKPIDKQREQWRKEAALKIIAVREAIQEETGELFIYGRLNDNEKAAARHFRAAAARLQAKGYGWSDEDIKQAWYNNKYRPPTYDEWRQKIEGGDFDDPMADYWEALDDAWEAE